MKTNPDIILVFSLAQRHAMRVVRQEYRGLSKNAIDVLIYATTKAYITANEVATKCLFSNAVQAKATIKQLIERGLLLKLNRGIKGRPTYYSVSVKGRTLAMELLNRIRMILPSLDGKSQ